MALQALKQRGQHSRAAQLAYLQGAGGMRMHVLPSRVGAAIATDCPRPVWFTSLGTPTGANASAAGHQGCARAPLPHHSACIVCPRAVLACACVHMMHGSKRTPARTHVQCMHAHPTTHQVRSRPLLRDGGDVQQLGLLLNCLGHTSFVPLAHRVQKSGEALGCRACALGHAACSSALGCMRASSCVVARLAAHVCARGNWQHHLLGGVHIPFTRACVRAHTNQPTSSARGSPRPPPWPHRSS